MTQAEWGWGSGWAQEDPPTPELDEHEDIERPEPGGLDAEDVAGDDPIRLGPEELGPGRPGPPRGGTESRRPEQAPDRRRSHSDPELAELALDPHAAPARVLAGQPEDQLPDLGIDRRPSGPTLPSVRPLSPHQRAVPPEEVAGVTMKATHRSRGIARLAAASYTRSMTRSFGGPAFR